MNIDLQKELLVAQCHSMALLLNGRLGDENPWALIEYNEYDIADLAAIKKLMHELLYAPPGRGT